MKTDRELVDAVLRGRRSAFADLVRRYERIALATAWHVLRDYHLAQDATQNAFVDAFRRLAQLRSGDQFGGWVIRIAHRHAVRLAKPRRRTIPLEPQADVTRLSAPPTEDWSELLTAVGRLPEQERILVGLRYLEGHAVAEVARLTGRPLGTVTKQLSRALKRLASTLKRSSAAHDPSRR